MDTHDRHPALTRLDVLVGRWTMQPKVKGVGGASAEFSWQDDGAFLRQTVDLDSMDADAPQAWRDNAPFPTVCVIGLDGADQFAMLYADARGVHRVYRMTFGEGRWTMWRSAPGFNQRFTATVSADGHTMDGRWEMSKDGQTWNLDFELTYVRRR